MLKKQTIWLITMLSLVVVLSVYYVTSEPINQSASDVSGEVEGESTDTNVETSQVFEELRIELEDKRSQMKSELSSIVAATDASAEDKSTARDRMISLEETSQKETMLESLIESIGYNDVFVQADGETVQIRVQAEELTKEQANKIMQLTENELGSTEVAVSNQVK